MLEGNYPQRLAELVAETKLEINVPREWQSIAARRGPVQPMPGDNRRRFVRFFFPTQAILELGQSLPTIDRRHAMHQVLTKDLSRDGICFLHSEQLFPHEQLVLWLPVGKKCFEVARCRRLNGRCYEIGARMKG
jgi:hypothetical protein